MDALNQKITALEERQRELTAKKEAIENEEHSLNWELSQLEQERLRLAKVLRPEDEEQLRKELEAVGHLLELSDVIHGSLRIVSEEPADELYSIDIRCSITFDTGVSGLWVDVAIKTKDLHVVNIVKTLFEQERPPPDWSPLNLSWEKDWDYGYSIRFKGK